MDSQDEQGGDGGADEKLSDRIACSDLSCVGTIGEDGTCRYCGAAYDGELPTAVGGENVVELPEDASADAGDDDPEGHDLDRDAHEVDLDSDERYWRERRLCPDGSCIGVIGPDKVCTECGRPG